MFDSALKTCLDIHSAQKKANLAANLHKMRKINTKRNAESLKTIAPKYNSKGKQRDLMLTSRVEQS